MTSRKLKRLHHRLSYLLRTSLPELDEVSIGRVANRLEQFVIYQAFELVKIEHEPGCACWLCLDAVHLEVWHHQCEMLANRRIAEQHD